jgi:protocatechuate 3,4-dioxygenase beta subunit
VVYIKGRVVDNLCRPVANANVEIWQACASGRYNSPKDPNPAALDPNFKYWAETFTNEKGEYMFKSIIPGPYPADEAWDRPPHVHFKISKLGFKDLVTQMYFKGDALNDVDLILNGLPSLERESVIVDFKPSPIGFEPNSKMGFFEISLRSVRG